MACICLFVWLFSQIQFIHVETDALHSEKQELPFPIQVFLFFCFSVSFVSQYFIVAWGFILNFHGAEMHNSFVKESRLWQLCEWV